MRILVTGGAGFIGSHVADALAAGGHEVVTLDALLPRAHGSATPPPWCRAHRVVVGDLRDADLLRRELRGIDAVCHQAAAVGHGVDASDAPFYTANNDHATAVLLAEAYAAGIRRLVLASSMVIYGEGRYACPVHATVRPAPRAAADLGAGRFDPPCPRCGRALSWRPVPEDATPDPRSLYAVTKLAQEQLAAVWARQCGGEVWALRYHNVYGPRMPRGTPYAGVASIFRSALAEGVAPRVLEDGRQCRDFVHVSDVARANVLALGAPPPGGFAAVNICSGEPRTVGEFAAVLAGAMGGPAPIVVGGARPGDVRHIVASPDRARTLLGFRSGVGFAAGVTAFAGEAQRPAVAPPAPDAVTVTSASAAGG